MHLIDYCLRGSDACGLIAGLIKVHESMDRRSDDSLSCLWPLHSSHISQLPHIEPSTIITMLWRRFLFQTFTLISSLLITMDICIRIDHSNISKKCCKVLKGNFSRENYRTDFKNSAVKYSHTNDNSLAIFWA